MNEYRLQFLQLHPWEGMNMLTFAWLIIFISQLSRVDATFYYINADCALNNKNFTKGSAYDKNRDIVLSDLSTQSTTRPYYNSTAGEFPNRVYAMYQCRGDVTQEGCSECIQDAVEKVVQGCPTEVQGSAWYYECILRYANFSFFSSVDFGGGLGRLSWDRVNVSNYAAFAPVLDRTLDSLINEAQEKSPRGHFATKSANYTMLDKVYCLAQCNPYLDELDCSYCLTEIKSNWLYLCNGCIRAGFFFASCQIMYDTTQQFYREIGSDPPSVPGETPIHSPTESGLKISVIAGIAVGAFFGVILLAASAWFCLCRKTPLPTPSPPKPLSPQPTTPSPPSVQPSVPTPPPFKDLDHGHRDVDFVEYDFTTLKVATNDFSDHQKLGQGGFGIVYLGTLNNGQKVAVKRLFTGNSRQAAKEFMAEAQIVAKLQHKNLVELLGSCSTENEKLLVFEFLPNKSLDHYLFDPTKRSLLVWDKRYNIIIEIAKGIQYLHVDSRIKIIHRDLKPNNILLDIDMNPKIADFGMARLLERGQMLGNTAQVIGTRGYMAPEYWRGEYSEKSDVYSFGIIILELISGLNNRVLTASSPGNDLPTQAWRLWDKDQSLQLMDDTLYSSYSMVEVIRCIHIGLLCVQEYDEHRPTMVQVVYMLTTSMPLPQPTAPSYNHFNVPMSSSDEGGKSDQYAARYTSRTDVERDLYPR